MPTTKACRDFIADFKVRNAKKVVKDGLVDGDDWKEVERRKAGYINLIIEAITAPPDDSPPYCTAVKVDCAVVRRRTADGLCGGAQPFGR